MRTRNLLAVLPVLVLAPIVACDDPNPFRSITPDVVTGESRVWELGLETFPSGYDIPSAERFFVGPSSVFTTEGTFVLGSRDDGTLVFQSYSALAPSFSTVRVGLLDLGAVPFASVMEVPESGYSSVSDTLGVPVQEGHTYAIRIAIPSQGLVFINFAKLHVLDVGLQFPQDPGSRFAHFEYAYQIQPLNRTVAVPGETP